MRFSGKIYKDGKFWLAEIPILDLMTQGHTKKEAFEMVADMLESLVNKKDFKVKIFIKSKNSFEVGSLQSKYLISLLLQRKRENSGLTISQVAKRLGVSSRSTYARYEQGKSVPTVEKFNELIHALCPNINIVIEESVIS
jgi:DNA-binding XRE family transcriptional regulator/predicted RNase H-like HicB family nuclease